MAWQDQLTIIVRTLINDLDTPYEYSDSRIEQVMTVAGKYVQLDVNLDRIYNIDVVNQQIFPDPTSYNDEIFISLICLKTACIIDQGTFRTKAAIEGIRAALGPSSLGINGNLTGWKEIINHGACGLYDELTSYWDVKNASAVRAVLSPFVGNKFDPRSLLRGAYRSADNVDNYS